MTQSQESCMDETVHSQQQLLPPPKEKRIFGTGTACGGQGISANTGRQGTRQGTRATSHRGTPQSLWTTTTQTSTSTGADGDDNASPVGGVVARMWLRWSSRDGVVSYERTSHHFFISVIVTTVDSSILDVSSVAIASGF
jgi:hypothetical protein